MSTPFLPTFWWHGDVVDLQARLMTGLNDTDKAIKSCAKVDAPTLAEWTSFFMLATLFCQQDAAWLNTGQQADVGQDFERRLIAWQHRLSDKCTMPMEYTMPGDNSTADISGTIKWIVAGLGVVAVAYAVGEVASTVRSTEAIARR